MDYLTTCPSLARGWWRWGLVTLLLLGPYPVDCWNKEWQPNYAVYKPGNLTMTEVFNAELGSREIFKLLQVFGNWVFIGARNRLFVLQFRPFEKIGELYWPADNKSMLNCYQRGKRECDNFLTVAVTKDANKNIFFICGTHAYKPSCATYTFNTTHQFHLIKDVEPGIGMSPYDPLHNSTAIYADGHMFTATVAGADESDPLILSKFNLSNPVRTYARDSLFLNEPDFVSSFEKNDKVFFFFREMAIENINCGKAIFARVARVCTNDRGNTRLQNHFTSFFKARLNCSIPGDFPFYFDELQSTTELGQGNHRPTLNSGDRSDMIYGVFNTPENSIRGSAICAFSLSKIEETFRGRFKGQESYRHNWLPVGFDDTPIPHPAMCTNDSQQLNFDTLWFTKKYPLMDNAVPSAGGMPLLLFTSFKSKFTSIAVDWQVLAADGFYYDVMFVGTDDGRVIKAINKGKNKADSVVIEDLQVLKVGEPVVSLKVVKQRTIKDNSYLLVTSRHTVMSIPLHRCSQALTCRACVFLQDPYCAWTEEFHCINAQIGVQNISSGYHRKVCPHSNEPYDESDYQSTEVVPTAKIEEETEITDGDNDNQIRKVVEASEVEAETEIKDETKIIAGATTSPDSGAVSLEMLIVAIIVSLVGSLILGFFLGCLFQRCRQTGDPDRSYSSLQRPRNRLTSGDNPYYHAGHSNLVPKQTNFLVSQTSGKGNLSPETQPMTKSNKVYV